MTWQEHLRLAVQAGFRNFGGVGTTDVEILRPMRSYAAFNHKDANHKEIADALRKQGAEVVEIMQPLDLLVKQYQYTAFAEVKRLGSKAKWTRPQLTFIAYTQFPVVILTDVEMALNMWVRTDGWITRPQKDRLAGFLLRNNDKFFTPKEIAEVLG